MFAPQPRRDRLGFQPDPPQVWTGERLIYLRNGTRQIPLRTGEYLIGRAVECHLVLGGDLVSRRHALIRIDAGQASIEDLRSTNGVVVNGYRISGVQVLRDGDRIVVGSTEFAIEMVLSVAPWMEPAIDYADVDKQDLRLLVGDDEDSSEFSADEQTTGRHDMLTILGAVAEKSIAKGQPAHAERVMSVFLAQMLSEAVAGRAPAPADIDRADRFCIRLAVATGEGKWVNHIFEVHAHSRQLLPSPIIDELLGAVRKLSQVDGAALRRYLEAMQPQAAQMTASQRFLLQRAEALGRVIAAK